MKEQLTEEQFDKDVAEHRLTVLRDDGLYRHLRFGRTGTNVMQFDLITWPGHLAYTGDMGSYVFSRIPDMLEFFRGPIDPAYCAEKCLAADRHAGLEEFDLDAFVEAVREGLDEFAEAFDLNEEQREQLRHEAEVDVLETTSESDLEVDAYRAAMELTFEGRQVLPDFYETRCRRYPFHLSWCLRAISWAIKRYDSRQEAAA